MKKMKTLALLLGLILIFAGVHAATEKIVILTSDNEADLAVANALASTINVKVVVTPWGTLSNKAITEIKNSGATQLYVIGGEVAVPEVEEKINNIKIKRFAGKDRYETSALVAEEWKKWKNCSKVIIAEGHDFSGVKDAMEKAKLDKCPVVFVKPEEVPESVEKALKALNVSKTVIIEAPNMNKTKIHLRLKVRLKEIEDIKADWKERAQEAITNANETIAQAEDLTENITDAKSAAATKLIITAKYHLSKAEEAFNEGKYGKAFGLAIAARENALSAIKIASGIEAGNFRKEVQRFEERIKAKGLEEVRKEICQNAEKLGLKKMKQVKKKPLEEFQQVGNKTEKKL